MQADTIDIIAHVGAGGGQGARILQEVEAALRQRGLTYQVALSDYPGHIQVLARERAHAQQLIVIGGDGTLHEVVASLAGHTAPPAILYLPAGRGNDFARAWQPKRRLDQALALWQAGARREVPILRLSDQTTGQVTYGLNSLGLGFDALVNQQSKALRLGQWLTRLHLGKLSYLVAVFASLPQLAPFTVRVTLDEGETPLEVRDCYLFSVLKNPYMGGGIRLDNLGQAQDPSLTVMAFHQIKPWHLPGLIWRVLVSHRQDQSAQVRRWTAQQMQLHVTDPVLGQLDGEIQVAAPRSLVIDWVTYPFILA